MGNESSNSKTYNQSYTDYQIKRNWLRKLIRIFYLKNTLTEYFPINLRVGGNFFIYNELIFIYDKKD